MHEVKYKQVFHLESEQKSQILNVALKKHYSVNWNERKRPEHDRYFEVEEQSEKDPKEHVDC